VAILRAERKTEMHLRNLLLLVAAPFLAAATHAQQPYDWTPNQTYTDSIYGVTFQTPSTWKPTRDRQSMFAPMLIESDDPAPAAAFYDLPAPGHYANTNLSSLYFTYAHKNVSGSAACDKLAMDIVGEENAKPYIVSLNGLRYAARGAGSAGLGSSAGGILYNTFRTPNCYLFETTTAFTNSEAFDTGRYLRPGSIAAINAHLLDIMHTVHIGPPSSSTTTDIPLNPPPLATYTDPKNGVSFQYPSVWKPVADPTNYGQSLVKENSPNITPVFAVEFSQEGNLYQKTNLTGLAYVYFATPSSNATACATLGDVNQGQPPKPTNTIIHGVRFRHSTGGDGGMSQWMTSDAYSVYRNGACFIFEEIFKTVNAQVADKHNLTKAQTTALQHHLDAITQSIVFAPLKP
jgi:hypothetical protein